MQKKSLQKLKSLTKNIKLNEEYKDEIEKLNDSIASLGLEEKMQAFRNATLISMFAAANTQYIEDILANMETCLPTEVFENDLLFSELLGLLQSFYPIVKKKRKIETQA